MASETYGLYIGGQFYEVKSERVDAERRAQEIANLKREAVNIWHRGAILKTIEPK